MMAILVTVLIIAAVLVVALIVATMLRKRRTAALQQHFGTEYDRTVEAADDRRGAEAELRGREKQRAQLDIRPLPEGSRARAAEEWSGIQERFVDQPSTAVISADSLVCRVMAERGYPMTDFDSQAQLVSVDHPAVVENFRIAHGIFARAQTQQANTEDLREALLRYRSLFDELLRRDESDDLGETGRRGAPETPVAGHGDASSPAAEAQAQGLPNSEQVHKDETIGGSGQ